MQRGFALITTLVMMILLVVIAVGLLSLSSISLRSGDQQRQMRSAQANARLALMLAIGQLQKEMGPDQRISAPAALQDTDPTTSKVDGVSNPRYTGVWKAAPPLKVDSTGDNMGTPTDNSPTSSFRRWLISGTDTDTSNFAFAKGDWTSGKPAKSIATAIGGQAVVDPAADTVKVPVIAAPNAGIAWWTSDNGQKATIRPNAVGTMAEPGDLATVLASSRRFNPKGYQVADPLMPPGDTSLPKVIDLPTADAGTSKTNRDDFLVRKYFHDLTTLSEMIPVNVTTGALKRCMNLRLAWLQDQDDTTRVNEGVFGLGSYGPSSGTIAAPTTAKNYNLFSWDQLRSAMAYTMDNNVPSNANAAKLITFGSTGRPQVTTGKQYGFAGQADDKEYNPNMNRERWRLAPVPIKAMYIVSASTDQIPSPPDPTKDLALRLNVYPVITLWNPYNVDLVVPEYLISAWAPPWNFTIKYGTPETTQNVNFAASQRSFHSCFGREVPVDPLTNPSPLRDLLIPAGENQVLYPAAFNPASPGNNRGNGGTHPESYIWMTKKSYDLASGSPPNYGLPFMNLKGGGPPIYPSSGLEVFGASEDPVKISFSLAGLANYTLGAEGSDGHANSGIPGLTDWIATHYWHSFTADAGFRIDPNSPQVALNPPTLPAPAHTFGSLNKASNGGQPIIIFTCHRKTLDEKFVPNKCWSFSMPSHPFHAKPNQDWVTDYITPAYESGFTYSVKSVNAWADVAKELQQPLSSDQTTYMCSSFTPAGQLRALAQEIPLVPPVSLAQLQHLPLFDYKPEYVQGADWPNKVVNNVDFRWGDFMRGRFVQYPQNNAIGNSYATPGIAPNSIYNVRSAYNAGSSGDAWAIWEGEFSNFWTKRIDHSYVANKLLWDAWWCSSMMPQNGPFFTKYGSPRTLREVAEQFVKGERVLPNEACRLETTKTKDQVLDALFDSNNKVRKEADQKLAAFIRISGGFNVNSASEKAWEQLFAQMLSRPVVQMNAPTAAPAKSPAVPDKFLVSRYTLALADPAERSTGRAREDRWWDGSRELTATDLTKLAQATVQEIKKRGPFLSMADFVNRSLTTDTPKALKGALQAALDHPTLGLNTELASGYPASNPSGTPNYKFPEAAQGALRQGIPGWVTQADLLQTIGPVLSPRSDTFTIRAMGDSRDASGNVVATAWCEAVVQRGPEYIDPADAADTPSANLTNPVNQTFGRRINIVSFRWLASAEVN